MNGLFLVCQGQFALALGYNGGGGGSLSRWATMAAAGALSRWATMAVAVAVACCACLTWACA